MWICSSCSTKNNDSFQFCSNCGKKRPLSNTHGSKNSCSGEWVCPKCSAKNSGDFLFCSACGVKRAQANSDGSKNSGSGEWMCPECSTKNNSDFLFCSVCGAKRSSSTPSNSNTPGGGQTGSSKIEIRPWVMAAIIVGAFLVGLLVFLLVGKSSTGGHASNSTSASREAGYYTYSPVTASPVQTPPMQTTAPDSYWTDWSEWSPQSVYASSTREVQTKTDVIGYNMVHYGTQKDTAPYYYRMFRNYSIQNDMDMYDARTSYGEKHLTRYVDAWQMQYAIVYPPDGSFITLRDSNTGEVYNGFQMGTDNAYYFGDDLKVWFIESEVYGTFYRYRDLLG